MELRLPLEVFPGRQATCRAVFGTWGSFPDDARGSHCPFVLSPVFLPETFHRQRSLVGHSPWSNKLRHVLSSCAQTRLSTIVIINLTTTSFFFPSLLLPSHTCSVWPVFHSYKWPHSYHFWLCQPNSQLSAPVSLPGVLSLVIKTCFANPCGRPEVPRNLTSQEQLSTNHSSLVS